MKNTDFISIYNALDLKEQKSFKHYIKNLYSNKKTVLALFDKIVKAINSDDKIEGIRKNFINEKNKQNDYADLKKWLLQFLTFQEIEEETVEAKFLELEALRKRGLYDVFEQKSNQLTKEFDKVKSPHLWFLFFKWRLSHINLYHVPLTNLQNRKPEFENLMNELDDFYIASKLQYSAELYNRSKVLKDKYDIKLLNEISALVSVKTPKTATIKTLYVPMLELVKNPSWKVYEELKQFLIGYPEHDALERQAILMHLINFTIRQLQIGDRKILQESFDLYEFGIKNGLFTILDYFSSNTFLNIINAAYHLGKHDWIQDFIKQHAYQLDPNYKDETIALAEARIAFDQKEYDVVLEKLSTIKPKNINFDLNIRTLLLRTYYEQQYKFKKEFILSANENLYSFIKNSNKMGDDIQKNAQNFNKMYHSLVSGRKTKEQLLKELEEFQRTMICYDWIKMKIEEL